MTDYERSASATSTEELMARIRAHHETLLRAAGEMPKNADRTKLENVLKTYLRPFLEEMSTATEHARARNAAVAYLGVCRTHVISGLPEHRRHPEHEELEELERWVHGSAPGEHGTLVHAVRELARSVDRLHESLGYRLEEISSELNTINTALQPISSPQGVSGKSLALLADIDLTMTQFAKLLVGSLPAKTKAIQGILDSSTNPGPDGSGQGTSSTGQTKGGGG